MARSDAAICLALFAAAVLVAPAGQAAQTTTPFNLGDYENEQLLYLEAQSASAGPFLSPKADAGSATSYTGADVAAGAAASLGAYSGTRPAPLEFKLAAPLGHNLWLNLSKPIVGALFFQTAASTITSRESMTIQVELWVGGVLAGGDSYVYGANVVTQPWIPMYFKFRPEVATVKAMDEVTLKVYRLSGLTEITVGTAGAQQSYVELRYFDSDPLEGALYLEGRQLIASSQAPGGGEFILLAAGLLVVPVGLRRRPALLLTIVFLAPALGGCLSGAADSNLADAEATAHPTATASVNQTTDDDLRVAGKGAVEGYVRDGDNAGIPLRGAHVAFLGTSLFKSTNVQGHFEFENMTPGTFVLRVDAEKFASFEQQIVVEVGTRSWVNVSLVRPGAQGDQTRIHSHDLWGEETVKPLFESTFLPTSYPYDLPPSANTWQAYSSCAGTVCETPIPLPLGTLVLPGTAMVEVALDWQATGAAPKELQLRIVTSGNKTADQLFVMRGPKAVYRIPIFPNEADSGHQTGTDWSFYVRIPPVASLYNPHAPPEYIGATVRATAKIHKGVIPLEPTHRNFWNGADQVTVIPKTEKVANLLCCGAPYYPGQVFWDPAKGVFVPPGTKELQGTFATTVQGAGNPYPWKLVYHAANSPAAGPWQPVPLTSAGGGAFTFTLPVTPEMTDQFYQTVSKWRFTIDDDIPPDLRPAIVPNHGTQQKFSMSATAVRDPAFNEGTP
ncbi:MAG: carboxypeptidase regulatory-like domain-containing protein [Euryarchaeota archaeon]|nr:carboxypeptidase regulatory-like domain-containing protein [Euryarchaeota archaeon]